jgi:hypothetical protein
MIEYGPGDPDLCRDPRCSWGECRHVKTTPYSGWTDAATEARIAWRTHYAMRHTNKPCIGGECDDVDTCRRHERTAEVVERMMRRRI